MQNKTYTIYFVSVDGAGIQASEPTLAGACVVACWSQCISNAHGGNPWNYRYTVPNDYSLGYSPPLDTLPLLHIHSEWLALAVDRGSMSEAEYNQQYRENLRKYRAA